jgi:hypothetical protein
MGGGGVSRSYSVICMNHNPPLEIDWGPVEWRERGAVTSAVRERQGPLSVHNECELIIAEYSGGLIGLGHVSASTPRGSWIDIEWARLLYAAHLSSDARVAAALEAMPMHGRHWTYERLHALRDWLGKGAQAWA